MVRAVGASALALIMISAAASTAQARYRHHTAYAGSSYRHVHYVHVRHYAARARHYAGRRVRVALAQPEGGYGYAVNQDARRVSLVASSEQQVTPRYSRRAFRSAYNSVPRYSTVESDPSERRVAYSRTRVSGGRPRAWCGWYARSLVGSDPGPAYNLARNWAHWGHASGPGVGVMVVWSHHVGMITGRSADGQWIVKSGNDGHGVRERPRSISGAIAFRAS
jgi:hypothetical protein